jgi:hypothetical protein
MGGCSSKADPKDYVASQDGPVPNGGANGHREEREGGSRRGRPAVEAPRDDRSNRRPNNNTVDFQEFKDKEKNVVETMLESNKGLRMAEINFNDLKLQKIIGAGAFGEVIKGTYCGTPVVVKRMLRNKITEDNLRMFGDEIQLMMNLRHPNIVQFIGASWNSYSNMYGTATSGLWRYPSELTCCACVQLLCDGVPGARRPLRGAAQPGEQDDLGQAHPAHDHRHLARYGLPAQHEAADYPPRPQEHEHPR